MVQIFQECCNYYGYVTHHNPKSTFGTCIHRGQLQTYPTSGFIQLRGRERTANRGQAYFFYATPVIAHFPISSIRAFLLPFIAKQSRMPRIAVDAERPASMPEESVHNDFYAQVLICRCLTLALRNSEPSYLAC